MHLPDSNFLGEVKRGHAAQARDTAGMIMLNCRSSDHGATVANSESIYSVENVGSRRIDEVHPEEIHGPEFMSA